jgi:hypothetical protein
MRISIWRYLLNILILIDISANVFIGGVMAMLIKTNVPALSNPHYTCSEAWAEMRDLHLKGEPIWMYRQGCFVCKILTAIQNHIIRIKGDHCTESMDGVPPDITAG